MAGREADRQCRLGMRMARIMEGDVLDQTVAVLMGDIVRTSGHAVDRAVDDDIARYSAAAGREDLDRAACRLADHALLDDRARPVRFRGLEHQDPVHIAAHRRSGRIVTVDPCDLEIGNANMPGAHRAARRAADRYSDAALRSGTTRSGIAADVKRPDAVQAQTI